MSNITTLCKNMHSYKTVGPYILNRSLLPIKDIITVHPSYYFFPKIWLGNAKERVEIEVLKKQYPGIFLFQYGCISNGYISNDYK